ncbi:MAG: shikimate 5-dehydrogenase [Polyangiaceae bacterium]
MALRSPITLCGSLSLHPVSLGAAMHSAGYRALGLPFVYVPFALVEADLPAALAGMRALGIRGFGVSMPFKLSVMPLLDRLDPLAERIGAVNTIVNDDGVLTGHNTDAWGAARALAEALPLAGKRVVVIGAGGAARAAAFAFHEAGMRVHIANRTKAKAEALARDIAIDIDSSGLDGLAALDGVDAVVNCSSAGMDEYGAEVVVPEGLLQPGRVIMDIVYKPVHTRLIEAAERAGARTVHGGRMLLHQACRQFELYTGRDAPIAVMQAALEAGIGQ